MKRASRKVAFVCVCCLPLLAGCFGKSPLTTGVVKWHSELEMEKYSKEALYVPIFFLVLPFTSIVDAFIVNAINFWTKEDPLEASALTAPAAVEKAQLASAAAPEAPLPASR